MEPFPSQWNDTPANRDRWQRLQNSNAFLRDQERSRGVLSCHYCGVSPLRIVHWSAPPNEPYKATVDHVIPVARGGPDHPSNMVVSCFPCNAKKADRMPY
ncbi:hypothetical protein HYH03_007093 [Edaphochlamys debaryana]|uniref:HNH nuclease domain-containing protein n=1 Tax=Edaphochlamys debaryana TaxID=47281 RepID=A0A835Y2R9_9CHLO|nr:hypothetical protein HYH03_007093 [Edaphochlamys debaryana]|eukprot:KAG2494853.1 hypothetical protein HYH03_007093 [Edaphochlamys debaryana]